jgi:hypothetical protein
VGGLGVVWPGSGHLVAHCCGHGGEESGVRGFLAG